MTPEQYKNKPITKFFLQRSDHAVRLFDGMNTNIIRKLTITCDSISQQTLNIFNSNITVDDSDDDVSDCHCCENDMRSIMICFVLCVILFSEYCRPETEELT